MTHVTLETLMQARDSLLGRAFVDAEGVVHGKFVKARIWAQCLVGLVALNRRGRKICCCDSLEVTVLRATHGRVVKVGRM